MKKSGKIGVVIKYLLHTERLEFRARRAFGRFAVVWRATGQLCELTIRKTDVTAFIADAAEMFADLGPALAIALPLDVGIGFRIHPFTDASAFQKLSRRKSQV